MERLNHTVMQNIEIFFIKNIFKCETQQDEVAEWLRRWTANPLGSARVGSNPILVGDLLCLISSLPLGFTANVRRHPMGL